MKKIVLIAALLSVLAIGTASAQSVQFRMDGNLSWAIGFFAVSGSTVSGTFGDVMKLAIIVPEFDAYAQLNMDIVRIGLGFRLFTIILESVIIPDVFCELNIDPLVIRLGVTGGALFIFGIVPIDPQFGPTFASDLYVGFKISELFRLGAGCSFIVDLNHSDIALLTPYINAKLVIALPEAKKSEQ
jgi:hypothetical protein